MASETAVPLVLITGPSGAGRTTAINTLEDNGFEVIDNMPLRLLPPLLASQEIKRPLALGVDVRNRDFSAEGLLALIEQDLQVGPLAAQLLYLDCAPDELIRRFSATRRRHPLAPAETPQLGIEREIDLLRPIRDRADYLLDTTEMTVHQTREQITRWFAPGAQGTLSVSLQSFSYKRGLPRGLDMAFDARFLRNPYWREDLRAMNGTDATVAKYVQGDPRFDAFFAQLSDLVTMLLPAFRDEGKSYLSIGIGCTGGQHRSVTVVEALAERLTADGWQVSVRHREAERWRRERDR